MSLNPETPSSDEIAAALGKYLEEAGLPPILTSIIDHLQVLFHLEMVEPQYYFMGASPAEKTYYHDNEIIAVRSILASELARLGGDSPILTPPGLN